MIDRRQAITLLSATALGSSLIGRGASAFIERNERSDYRKDNATKDIFLNNLPLRLRDRNLVITTIFLLGATSLWMLRAAIGVDQRNENRVNLGGIPLLGGLLQRSYGRGDFIPDNRFGALYAEAATLFIYLNPQLLRDPQVRQLLFFNLASSFMLRDSYQPATWQMMAALMPTFCAIETVRRVTEARLNRPAPTAPAPAATPSTAFAPGEMDHLMLAGLVSETPSDKGGVPVLGDLPLLNKLFAGAVHKTADDQLLMLVRPSIVVGDPERS